MDILSGRALVGKVLRGRYRLDAFVGKGGMSWVFRGYDTQTGLTVAIKVLLPHLVEEARVRARFEDEGRYQGRLHHANIVQVYDVFSDGTVCAIVMEWIVGEDLRDLLKRLRQSIPLTEIWHLMSAILDAMSHAHACSLIHRDLKPSNILLHEEGLRMIPKVADFGIAKAIDEQDDGLTRTGASLGTLKYMAPEQFLDSKHVDQRADIYSLGVLLFLLLTGRLPFRGDSQVVLYKQMHEGPPSPRSLNPDISEFLEYVLLRCLSTMPEQRYASCDELARALALAMLLEFGVDPAGFESYPLEALREEVHAHLVEMGDATAVGDREGFAVGTMLYQSFVERPRHKESPDGLHQEHEGGSGGALSSVDASSERSENSSESGERLSSSRSGFVGTGRPKGSPVLSALVDESAFPPEDLSFQDPTRPLPTRSLMAAFRPPVDPQDFFDAQHADANKEDLTSAQGTALPLSQKTVVQGFVSPFADALSSETDPPLDTPMRKEQRAAWGNSAAHAAQGTESLAFAPTLAAPDVVITPSEWTTTAKDSAATAPSSEVFDATSANYAPSSEVFDATPANHSSSVVASEVDRSAAAQPTAVFDVQPTQDEWEVRTSQAVDSRPPLFLPQSPEQAEAHDRLDGKAALEALFRKPERRPLSRQGDQQIPVITTKSTPPSLSAQQSASSGTTAFGSHERISPEAPPSSASRSVRAPLSSPKTPKAPKTPTSPASVLFWVSAGGIFVVWLGLALVWFGLAERETEIHDTPPKGPQASLAKIPKPPRTGGFWDEQERPVWVWESAQGRPMMRWQKQRVWIKGKRPSSGLGSSNAKKPRHPTKHKKRPWRRKRR
ncbi:protein kinase [Myxococcota bacterium]|nr:protein kinase [Myxococcota bacterium]